MAANLQNIVSESLRAAALGADGGAREGVSLERVWAELTTGRATVVDSFCGTERCFLVLRTNPADAPVPRGLTPRNVEILTRSLLARMQKHVAHDLGITPSAVAFAVARGFEAMGLRGTASTAPALIVAAVLAHHEKNPLVTARFSPFEHASLRHCVYSISRPEPSGLGLSVAERAIVHLIAERLTNEEIARRRATSPRTVANQLSRILSKLEVDGRLGVVQRLVGASS